MKSLHDYLLGVRKENKIKIRFAVPLTDEMIGKVETLLKKYDLISFGSPKKTIFQSRAIGFEDPVNTEVTIIEVTLGLPFSYSQLRLEVARSIKVSETKVAIDGDFQEEVAKQIPAHEVIEVETYVGVQTQVKPVEINYEHESIYGDKYNTKMVKTIGDSRKEVKDNINKTAK